MTITKNNWFILALALGAAPLGCGDEATIIAPEPPAGAAGSPTGTAGTGGTGGEGTAGTNAGGAAGTSNAACVEDPVAPADFLVRCTDSACRPFDNASRLGQFRAGEPLPEVP
jgi:hypothetical protein